MSIDTYAESGADHEVYVSPFAGLSSTLEAVGPADQREPAQPTEAPFEGLFSSESPFSAEGDRETTLGHDVYEAIQDEEFEDALEDLLNEGAAHVVADEQQWSAPPPITEVRSTLEHWIAPLGAEWERVIDGLSAGLEQADLLGMTEKEFDEMLDSLESPSLLGTEGFDNFLGGLVRKAKNALRHAVRFAKNPVGGVIDLAKQGVAAVKSGIQTVGSQIVGPLLRRLKSAGLALLKGVVAKLLKPLTRVLPAPVRPLVPILAQRLGLAEAGQEHENPFAQAAHDESDAATLAEAFDRHMVGLLLDPEATEGGGEFFGDHEAVNSEHDPLADLDHARARLATELVEHNRAEPPVAEIEQFVPAVLAIRPLLKLGLTVTGAREKLISLIAKPLANLIKGMVGAQAAQTIARAVGREPSAIIARAVTDLGFSALGLEAAEPQQQALAGELLASAVEATTTRVLDELPEAALADPLQVSSAVQRAFAESAAAYLPDQLLRDDLPERETSTDSGFWILMPRRSRPRYRFRKYSAALPLSISRQVARAVPWSDGGTLEGYLLDRGVTAWPVQAEADLYETLPGTVPGHFVHDETVPAGEGPAADEFQHLTRTSAGLLFREPALGRGHRPTMFGRPGRRITPGHRYFRIRVSNLPARRRPRPRRLLSVRWDPTVGRLSVAVRLSERRARALHAYLERAAPAGKRDLPAVLSALHDIIVPALCARIAHRFVRSSFVTDPAAAHQISLAIAEATMSGISAFLTQRGAQLSAAVADPAEGVTIAVTFLGVTAKHTQTLRPTVTVHPGWQHA